MCDACVVPTSPFTFMNSVRAILLAKKQSKKIVEEILYLCRFLHHLVRSCTLVLLRHIRSNDMFYSKQTADINNHHLLSSRYDLSVITDWEKFHGMQCGVLQCCSAKRFVPVSPNLKCSPHSYNINLQSWFSCGLLCAQRSYCWLGCRAVFET